MKMCNSFKKYNHTIPSQICIAFDHKITSDAIIWRWPIFLAVIRYFSDIDLEFIKRAHS